MVARTFARARRMAHLLRHTPSFEHRGLDQSDSFGPMYVACTCGKVYWYRNEACVKWAEWVSKLHRDEIEKESELYGRKKDKK